jgi:hypothetical protein
MALSENPWCVCILDAAMLVASVAAGAAFAESAGTVEP